MIILQGKGGVRIPCNEIMCVIIAAIANALLNLRLQTVPFFAVCDQSASQFAICFLGT